MSSLDREHGYSCESRYEITAIMTFCELRAPMLPNWALPYADEAYSARDAPSSLNMNSIMKRQSSSKS